MRTSHGADAAVGGAGVINRTLAAARVAWLPCLECIERQRIADAMKEAWEADRVALTELFGRALARRETLIDELRKTVAGLRTLERLLER